MTLAHLQELKIGEIVYFPEKLAESILFCKLSGAHLLTQTETTFRSRSQIQDRLKGKNAIWELLVELEQDSALPFKLQRVAETVAAERKREE